MSMNKFWSRLLISQLILAGGMINLVSALTRHDFAPLTIEIIVADLLWYIGLLLQLPGSPQKGALHKISMATVLAGALMMVSVGTCRGFEITSLLSSLEVLLAFLAVGPILFGLGLGFVFLKRRASSRLS